MLINLFIFSKIQICIFNIPKKKSSLFLQKIFTIKILMFSKKTS